MKLAPSKSIVLAAVLAAYGCSTVRDASDAGGARDVGTAGRAADARRDASSSTEPAPGTSIGSGSAGYDPRTGEYIPGTTSCPAFACGTGARLYTEFPMSFEQALAATFEVCRNETCFTGQLPAWATMPDHGGTGVRLPAVPADDSDYAYVFLMSDEPGRMFLQVEWTPRDLRTLKDGDHYVVSVIDAAGKRTLLFDERVDYDDNSIGTPDKPCYQFCPYVAVDRRAGDAGVSESDAGG